MKLNLGENIRKYRKRIDWTQEQLADRLGVSYQSVSRWESGNGYPDMEHLPTMARLFSVTMDDLIGYGDENEKIPCHEMEKRFRKVLMSEDMDEIVSLMRLIRYEYMEEFDQIYFPLDNFSSEEREKFAASPKFMEELRLLVEEYMKCGRFQDAKHDLLELLMSFENEEHFEKLIEKHALSFQRDYSINGMVMGRAFRTNDQETYKFCLAIQRMRSLEQYFGEEWRFSYKHWDPAWGGVVPPEVENDLPDVPELDPFYCAEQSRRKLAMLHNFNGVTPDEAHPVSGDGELDLWVAVRVKIGFFYAAQLSACGEHELALTVLEDCTDLIEQARDFPGGIENFRRCGKELPKVTCRAPELAGIVAERCPVRIADTDLPPEVSISYRPERNFKHIKRPFEHISLGGIQNWHYSCLTEHQLPREGFRSSWFDPIREHPRYLAVVERILKTEGEGTCGRRKRKTPVKSSSDS